MAIILLVTRNHCRGLSKELKQRCGALKDCFGHLQDNFYFVPLFSLVPRTGGKAPFNLHISMGEGSWGSCFSFLTTSPQLWPRTDLYVKWQVIAMTFSHFCLDWEAGRHTPYTPRESGADKEKLFHTFSCCPGLTHISFLELDDTQARGPQSPSDCVRWICEDISGNTLWREVRRMNR